MYIEISKQQRGSPCKNSHPKFLKRQILTDSIANVIINLYRHQRGRVGNVLISVMFPPRSNLFIFISIDMPLFLLGRRSERLSWRLVISIFLFSRLTFHANLSTGTYFTNKACHKSQSHCLPVWAAITTKNTSNAKRSSIFLVGEDKTRVECLALNWSSIHL